MPDFLCKDMEQAKLLSEERVEYCLNGWRSVLTEHPKAFSEEPLGHIAETINDIIKWHEFLHGNEESRVRGIYDKMVLDFDFLQGWSD